MTTTDIPTRYLSLSILLSYNGSIQDIPWYQIFGFGTIASNY